MMQPGTKWVMIIGGAILGISLIAMIAGGIGFAENVSEEPTPQWEGVAPTTADLELSEASLHLVFIETGSGTSVIPKTEGLTFLPCESDDSCGLYTLEGMTYIGDLEVYNPGTYRVEFDGSGLVEVREIEIDMDSFFAAFGGLCGACCGGLLLLIGIIKAFTQKGQTATDIMMIDPTTGQIVQNLPVNQIVVQTPVDQPQTFAPIIGSQPAFEEPGKPPQDGMI